MQQAGTLGLDAHIDVFGDQTHELTRVFHLVFKRHIDNAVVVSLILSAIEKRYMLISTQ